MMAHILLDLASGHLEDAERRVAAQRALSELAILLPSMRVQLGLLDSEERGFERN